ncbi:MULTISPECIES: FprA family A-type flavoprotein [Muribaculum]|uniref:FprA family A-type flavoprotein n=1 Tax=Muribaculum TaxID=1918540 RepID=UPI00248B8E25|nr:MULTISPECIES: FprA family A-type flavoprotein [Muribaculum]
MNIRNITDGISYVGVNDRTTHRFEALWPLPAGVSYNSYIVKGSSKTALIDGVEISECDKLLTNIREIAGTEAPDYLVINHMEPDHSGSIKVLRSFFPEMTIVGNAKTLEMVKGFYGIEDNLLKVADNDTIDLGGLTLTFKLTPMVHWPETMMTYVNERNVLFSGDGFGCFGAINGGVIDSETDVEYYIPEMYRYYSNIVGKYGVFVQKALAKLKDLKIDYICSTHGPVWHDEVKRIGGIYDKLSRYEAETGVVIVYGSMYGNTEEMAEAIASRLAEKGIKNIRVHNASYSHLSYILSDIFRYKGLIIGAPTYSNTLYPPIESVMQAIKTRELKNRVVATFGSYTWAPQAVKRINSVLEEAKMLTPDMVSVEAKQAPSAKTLADCAALADSVTSQLLS